MPSNDWKDERHGGCRLDLGHGLDLVVSYEGMERLAANEPKWNVYVFGRKLLKRSDEKEAAKDRAERVARMWMTQAQDKVGGMLVASSDPEWRS